MESIIKVNGPWALIKQTEMRYFRNGKASMHIETRYHVLYQASDIKTCAELDVVGNRYWFKSKSEAMSYLKSMGVNHA